MAAVFTMAEPYFFAISESENKVLKKPSDEIQLLEAKLW